MARMRQTTVVLPAEHPDNVNILNFHELVKRRMHTIPFPGSVKYPKRDDFEENRISGILLKIDMNSQKPVFFRSYCDKFVHMGFA